MGELPFVKNEAKRLAELYSFGILDTEPESFYDAITKSAAQIFNVPFALISLIDKDRQWFKSTFNVPLKETPRAISFCSHAIAKSDIFIVEDSLEDDRFYNNPLVTDGIKIRFYCGVPLVTRNNFNLGTLCVIGDQPQKPSEDQLQSLKELAKCVVDHMENCKSVKSFEQKLANYDSVMDVKKARFLMEEAIGNHWQYKFSTRELSFAPRYYNSLRLSYDIPSKAFSWESYLEVRSLVRFKDFLARIQFDKNKMKKDFNIDLELLSQDGEYKWHRLQAKVFRENSEDKNQKESFLLYGIMRDISEEVNFRKGMERIEKDKQLILEQAGIGFWTFDLIKNEIHWDESMYLLYCVNPTDFTGDYDAWKKTLHPDDFGPASRAVEEAIKGEKEFDTSFRVITGKGNVRTIRAKAKVYKNSMNVPVRMSGLNYDITEQIEAEKKLEEQQKLSFQQSKLASIGELAAGVGHELNNPLQIMLGYMATIKHDVDLWEEGKDKDSFSSRIDKVSDAITRMTHIVSGLRTFSRDSGENIERFSPIEIMYSMVDFVRDIYRSYDIEIAVETDISAVDHFVNGDVSKLQQIFMNLFGNAKDALEGVPGAKISVNALIEKNNIVFEVSDNGSGIPMDIRQKVFDPFFTSKPVGKGTGIGLSITKNFVEDLNGAIKIKSSSKKGTVFKISIPVEESQRAKTLDGEQEVKVNERMTSSNGKAKPKVLIAEDEEGLREVFTKAMSRDGFLVETAADGVEAYEMFCNNKYDLLITDIQMPKMSGLDLLDKLEKEKKIDENTRVLILTGGVAQEIEDGIRSLNIPVEKVFYKPIRVKHLISYLNESEIDLDLDLYQ